MTFRRLTAGAITLVAASVTACASNVSGHGNDGSGPNPDQPGTNQLGGSSQSGAVPGATSALGPNTTPSQLANALTTALTSVKTAHINLTAGVLGQSITGSGDEQLSNGKLQAFQVTEQFPSGIGSIGIVIVGGKAWVKLPAGLGGSSSAKPWHTISASSSDPTVRSLASSLDTTLQSASIAAAGKFAEAAKSVKVLGKQTVNGMSATHVHMVVDPAKITTTIPGQQSSLQKLGLTSIPVDLFLDDQNRPVLTTTAITVENQKVTSKVEISQYDQPVSISPPPADQIQPG